MLMAFMSQEAAQRRQPMQFSASYTIFWEADIDSGFWHQTQERGQPEKNTVVLMPGPSSREFRFSADTSASLRTGAGVLRIFMRARPRLSFARQSSARELSPFYKLFLHIGVQFDKIRIIA